MDITPLTSDTQQGSARKEGDQLVRRVGEKPGDGGAEYRMCDRGSGHLSSPSGKLQLRPSAS